ncbi:thialysine N-epsilon-acetyltransferase-like [Paramacrobiotus metropolitanus]|uniref:thialysine N-epsilon-acetyltransferase-like n=1 Tax=Paramacrobiotus metropolitanus TaxID=2943436 RepID=UPI0024463A8F|nr:thialysine N-epsilon-acetyltransferase-like [Paramacrobiotus metropolitanus]
MPKPKPITPAVAKAVYKMREENQSYAKIANLFGYSVAWVQYVLKHFNAKGERVLTSNYKNPKALVPPSGAEASADGGLLNHGAPSTSANGELEEESKVVKGKKKAANKKKEIAKGEHVPSVPASLGLALDFNRDFMNAQYGLSPQQDAGARMRIRPAVATDCPEICSLIYELAHYQGFPTGPQMTADRLRQDGFPEPSSGQKPLYFALVAHDIQINKVVGYAIFYHFYSTWRGKAMYLEDIYVQPAYRRHGVGRRLLGRVCKTALDDGCDQMRLAVLRDNMGANDFYETLGMDNITLTDGWQFGKFETAALQSLAQMG